MAALSLSYGAESQPKCLGAALRRWPQMSRLHQFAPCWKVEIGALEERRRQRENKKKTVQLFRQINGDHLETRILKNRTMRRSAGTKTKQRGHERMERSTEPSENKTGFLRSEEIGLHVLPEQSCCVKVPLSFIHFHWQIFPWLTIDTVLSSPAGIWCSDPPNDLQSWTQSKPLVTSV